MRLPTDRSFDGVDLLPVLLGQHGARGHADLYHPNSGASGAQGALDAVRHLHYKAVWQTGGAFGCGAANRARPRRFEPPLLFDLEADPQEATPLGPWTHPLTYPLVLATVVRLRAAKEADINASFRSVSGLPLWSRPSHAPSTPLTRTHSHPHVHPYTDSHLKPSSHPTQPRPGGRTLTLCLRLSLLRI